MEHTVIFLPGIIAPAEVRYAALMELLPDVRSVLHNLAVYEDDEPPAGYSISTEVDALDRAADEAGLERFHLFGHSGGGAVGLAYASVRADRLVSLAVDEPAYDFTDAGEAGYGWDEFDAAKLLPPDEAMVAFMKLQVAPDVELPPPPFDTPPPWMAKRPAGIDAFTDALRRHRVEEAQYTAFSKPVYFSRGSRTHARWGPMQDRLARAFPDFTGEVFEGLHHLNPAHQNDPARVAPTLLEFWERAESLR